ncbi:MAG: CHAT domain-containing protein [Chloroflexales bacterium]|nr:CHAT domain-containing protein [Chloroflexales bacterium]
MDTFDDMLVRVQRKGLAGADALSYTVELWRQGGRRVNERAEVSLAGYSEPISSDPLAVAASGLDLFNRLFSGALAVVFQQAWAAATSRQRTLRLRLALDPNAPVLHAIPWELMYFDESGGLVPPHPLAADPHISFSRYIESATFDEGQPIAERPIRMLIGISSPADLERWQLAPLERDAEERDFCTRFSAAIASGQFRCDFLPAVTEEALHSALACGSLEGEVERGYDALLYYGHALHHDEAGTRLVLEDPQSGRVRLYDGEELISLMQKLPESHRPSLVIMVACNSAATGTINSLAARLLIEGGVPAVLAMQRLVEITLARIFTHSLSEHLLREGTIDVAVSVARRRVFQPDSLGWSTPVLYMRNAEGRLFSPNAQLEYVEGVLRDPAMVRWAGPDFIDVGVLAIAPGQDWNLLRFRPEDAPAVISATEALDRALGLGLRPVRRREEHEGRKPTNLATLIGPPQSGQSTVLRRLVFNLAEAVTHDVTRPLGIFISLAGYEQQHGQGRLERHIIDQARAVAPALGDSLTELFRPAGTRLSGGAAPRFAFLLDDLDAVPERARLDLTRDLAALARRLPGERFLITSAQESFPAAILTEAQVFVIQPLGEQQILAYLRQRDEQSAPGIFRLIRENRLLNLATDPSLIGLIYERLSADPLARLTRNQLVQDYLDRRLGEIGPRYHLGDAVRESLIELAWQGRWSHRERMPLDEVFRILAQVRRERDYSLEVLYDLLREARLLTGVGQHAARFVNPLLQAYCAALALNQHEASEHLADIVALCASPDRLSWWEDVIYALAGLQADPAPLFWLLAAAIRAGSTTHALLAARCLEAVPVEQEARLPAGLRAELIDACVLRLRSEREPSAERREQTVSALGRLSYHQVRHELRRILVEKVRLTASGPRYEYTNVRIAAARALRNIYLATTTDTPAPEPREAVSLVLSRYGDQASLADRPNPAPAKLPSLQDLRSDQMLVRMIRIWRKGAAGRDEFRDLLHNSPSAPERALAAFALGDISDTIVNKSRDAKQLLRVIQSPTDRAEQMISDDWQDTMWAAADALTLFDADLVTPLLVIMLRHSEKIPDSAAQQLAYLAGRVRATDKEVVDWLIKLLVTNPSQSVKAKALQSLAWMGMGIPDTRLELKSGQPGPSLKQLIQDIAAARQVRGLLLGDFEMKLRATDPGGSAIYLRRKAIEALAWIGDADTIKDLGTLFMSWPIELREHWYLAAATIEGRLAERRAPQGPG